MNATPNPFGCMPFAGHRTMGQVMRGEDPPASRFVAVASRVDAEGPNPFRCPPSVHQAMRDLMSPMLCAVLTLGPARVQWLGTPAGTRDLAKDSDATCWALDGRRATQGEILAAARGVVRG